MDMLSNVVMVFVSSFNYSCALQWQFVIAGFLFLAEYVDAMNADYLFVELLI